MQKEVDGHSDDFLEENIIEPSLNPWASTNIILVKTTPIVQLVPVMEIR